MKALQVIDALGVGGGAEHSLASLLPRLRERGIDSVVATLLPRDGGIEAALRDEGFEVVVLGGPAGRGGGPLGRLRQVADLRRLIKAHDPDLVHATLFHASLVARLATVGTGVPLLNSLVNTTYDPARISLLGLSHRKLRLLRAVDGFTLRRRVDHVHAITSAVRDEAVEVLGFPSSRVTVIPRGRDRDVLGRRDRNRRDAVRAELGVGPEAIVVLNVGRQDHQKGQVGLVEAMGEVIAARGDRSELFLWVAGRRGSITPDLEAVIESSGLGDRVRLLGHRTDVSDLLAAADIFAFPSLYEGLGCSLIEAMALELPIVGSDAPAIAEVLEHGDLGELSPRGDTAGLAAAITRLVDDPLRRRELAERGRSRFEERYDLDRVTDATEALYRSLVDAG